MNETLLILLYLLTIGFTLFGLFFMIVAAVGLVRLPDLYNRIHAATKGVTLGITGMLLAGACAIAAQPDATPMRILTTIVLVIVFQFIANPVGAHLLSKAAHMDGADQWDGTLSDDLQEDKDRR